MARLKVEGAFKSGGVMGLMSGLYKPYILLKPLNNRCLVMFLSVWLLPCFI